MIGAMARPRRLIPLLLAATAWLAPASVHPQDSAEAPWFTVEVVVFAHNAGGGLTEEIWPATPGRPDLTNAVALTPDGTPLLDSAPGEPPSLLPAGADGRQLGGIVRALKRSSAYDPLVHLAWRQAGLDRRRALPIQVRVGPPDEPPLLEGTLRVHLSRYLHLSADLVYARDVPPEGADEAAVAADQGAPLDGGASAPRRDTALFRLNQSRRMRSGEIHYVDHPVFGIIAEIRPHEFAAADTPAPDSAPSTAVPAGTPSTAAATTP